MRCVLCGKEIKKGTLCAKCYLEREEVVSLPNIIKLTTCPRCGFFKFSGKWKKMEFKDALWYEIESKLMVHPDLDVKEIDLTGSNNKYVMKIIGKFMNEEKVEIYKQFELRINRELCLKCSREAGSYYEAILQIRAENRTVSANELEEIKAIINETLNREIENPKAFITKIEEKKEGVDYYFGDRNIGKKVSRKIVEKLGGIIKESKKLAGRKDGRDIFRFTYLVRLPEYFEGDVVEDEGKIGIVVNRRLGKIITTDGTTKTLKSPKLLARKDEILKGIVVNMDNYTVEILDPETNEVKIAEKPNFELKLGEEVSFIKLRDKICVLPGFS